MTSRPPAPARKRPPDPKAAAARFEAASEALLGWILQSQGGLPTSCRLTLDDFHPSHRTIAQAVLEGSAETLYQRNPEAGKLAFEIVEKAGSGVLLFPQAQHVQELRAARLEHDLAAAWACGDPAAVAAAYGALTGEPAPANSFDLSKLRAGRFLTTKPDPIRWTFSDSLPQGSLGFVVSNGGVGKSWFLLQAAISVATRLDCLDGIFEIGERGRVFAIFGEDVEAVVHARTQAIFNSYMASPREGVYHDPAGREHRVAELQDRLFLLPGSGKDLRLVRDEGGNLAPSQTYLDLLALLKGIPDLKLVILDPVSRFYAGSENDNVQATYFCSLLERLARETGATVIISHHTHKGASSPNESSYNALFQGAIRGASGFTNAARWQMNLTTLRAEEVRQAGGNPAQHFNYIAGKVVKKNVGKPEGRFWMERQEGGVLRRFASVLGEDNSEVKERIVEFIQDLEHQGERMTRRQFGRECAAEIGLSRRKMEPVIDELMADGRLRVAKDKNDKGRMYDYLTAGTAPSAHSAQIQRPRYDE